MLNPIQLERAFRGIPQDVTAGLWLVCVDGHIPRWKTDAVQVVSCLGLSKCSEAREALSHVLETGVLMGAGQHGCFLVEVQHDAPN